MDKIKLIKLKEVDSTNAWLRDYKPAEGEELTIVTAEYQTAGKGQGKNTWESNYGENLLFSVLCHPKNVPANRQFILSQAIALAIRDTLRMYIGDVKIKWPNDIYWHDHKIGGTLIQCSLAGKNVRDCIIGIGIDVNQREFENLTKNPISIFQITGREIDREELLKSIVDEFIYYLHLIEEGHTDNIMGDYEENLYRATGYHAYKDGDGEFLARFISIEPSGHLILMDEDGMYRRYAFKEVKFLIKGKNVDVDQ